MTGNLQINTALKGYMYQKKSNRIPSQERLTHHNTIETKSKKQDLVSSPLSNKPSISILSNYEFGLPLPQNQKRATLHENKMASATFKKEIEARKW